MQRREKLAALLTDLIDDTYNEALRLEAAKLAVQIAVRDGDPTATDITESVVAGSPHSTSPYSMRQLRHVAATARGARQAIALTAPLTTDSPRSQILATTVSPEQVHEEVQARIMQGQIQLACSIVCIGLTRHPENPALREIATVFDSLLAAPKPPAPIPLVLARAERPSHST